MFRPNTRSGKILKVFCIISIVLFLIGFIIIKINETKPIDDKLCNAPGSGVICDPPFDEWPKLKLD